MKIKYKLTTQKITTYRGHKWVIGKWVRAKGKADQCLCTDGWLHCYDSPLLALLHNPIHANILNPRLWEVEVGGKRKNDRNMKCGYRRMRIVKEIAIPKITTTNRIAYAILCAKEVYKEKKWNNWAKKWLDNSDRTAYAAASAADAASAATSAAYAAYAATSAANAAYAATSAAYAAYAAASAAYGTKHNINLAKLAKQAMQKG